MNDGELSKLTSKASCHFKVSNNCTSSSSVSHDLRVSLGKAHEKVEEKATFGSLPHSCLPSTLSVELVSKGKSLGFCNDQETIHVLLFDELLEAVNYAVEGVSQLKVLSRPPFVFVNKDYPLQEEEIVESGRKI